MSIWNQSFSIKLYNKGRILPNSYFLVRYILIILLSNLSNLLYLIVIVILLYATKVARYLTRQSGYSWLLHWGLQEASKIAQFLSNLVVLKIRIWKLITIGWVHQGLESRQAIGFKSRHWRGSTALCADKWFESFAAVWEFTANLTQNWNKNWQGHQSE